MVNSRCTPFDVQLRHAVESDSDIKPVVGLHFAGGIGATYGIECKIQNVFQQLDLTTLCSGAFAAFIEALFDTEEEGAVSELAEARLRGLSALATCSATTVSPFVTAGRDRRFMANRRFHSGIARDIQARLQESSSGRKITGFYGAHSLGIGWHRVDGVKNDKLSLVFYVASASSAASRSIPAAFSFLPEGHSAPV